MSNDSQSKIESSAELRVTPAYTLDERLAQSNLNVALTEEDRAWIDLAATGREL